MGAVGTTEPMISDTAVAAAEPTHAGLCISHEASMASFAACSEPFASMTTWMSAGVSDAPHVGLPMVQPASITILAAFSAFSDSGVAGAAAEVVGEAFVAELHAMSHARAQDLSMAALCTSGIMTGVAATRAALVCDMIDEGPTKASAKVAMIVAMTRVLVRRL